MKLEIICPETSSQCLFFLFYYQTDVRESVWTTTPFKNTHCISSVWLFWLWRHPESTFTATLWLYRFVDATWTLEPELLRSLWREQRANTTAAAGPAAPGLKTKTIRTVEVWRCSKSPSGGEMRGFSVTFSPRQCQVCASLQMLSNETLSRNTVSQPPPSSSSSSPLHGSSNVPGRSKQQTTCTSRSIVFHPREAWRRHASRGQATFVFHDAFRKLFLLFPCDAALDWEAAIQAVWYKAVEVHRQWKDVTYIYSITVVLVLYLTISKVLLLLLLLYFMHFGSKYPFFPPFFN